MAAHIHRTLWRQLLRSRATEQLLQPLSSSSPSSLCTRPPVAAAFRASPRTSSSTPWRQTRRSYSAQSSEPPRPSPPPPPPPKRDSIKFWPFLLVIGLGSGGYVLLVKQRERANMPAISPPESAGRLPAPAKDKPTFSGKDVTVIFVLGGPGAGKGTQCARLVADYGFTHLSAGDLLRAEQDRPGSQFGSLIKDCIRNGAIVPMEVTVQLLENAMTETLSKDAKKARFLIDGFPRKMDQALRFEEAVCPARFVLFYDCPEKEMERRLLERGKTSGRADDNEESIRKRFRTFIDTSMPVVDYYEKEGRVVKIDATPKPDAVYKETRKRLEDRLGKDF